MLDRVDDIMVDECYVLPSELSTHKNAVVYG